MILGGVCLYKYMGELYRSKDKLYLSDFDIIHSVPDDINLSNNVKSNININKDKILNNNNPKEEILNAKIAYSALNKDLKSDFVVDIFKKNDASERFTITKLVKENNTNNALYISGNNDYFYHADMAYKLSNKGYNFYAISFPNFGFGSDVNDTNFSTFNNIQYLFQYIEIALKKYKINKIDILFGHSTGGLIGIMYANYKNSKSKFIDKLILSSPFLDWYEDPKTKSCIQTEKFLEYVITPLGLIIPKINLKSSKGSPNYTTCEEFNEINFNPKYKSLIEIHTYPEWIRACTLAHRQIQNKKIDVKCKVDILLSDKSIFWKYTTNADNTLSVADIEKYSKCFSSSKVNIHKIIDSIHSCFLRVNIEDFI